MSDNLAPWEKMQMKTFTAFANAYIMAKDKKYKIENGELPEAFENGVRLIVLIEQLMGGASLGKYHTKDNLMKPLKIENINKGLKVVNDFNQSKGIKLVYGAEAVMNGNRTEVMGLVWILISKFLLEHISEEDSSAKEALLLWCKRKTEGYDGCNVVDFGTCWQNGMAFCALLHKHRPDLLDYSSLSPANAADNLELAFSIGEKELGIPRLLEVEDMTDMTVKPDEKSVMTYLMFVWKVFASYKQVEVAGRRIQKFIKTEKHNDALKKSYEASAKELMAWINEMIAYLHTADFGPNEDSVEAVYGKHSIFKNEEKPTKRNEMTDVQSSVSFIASKLLQEGRPPYELPEDLTTEFMEKLWKQMVDAEYVFEDLLQSTITQLTKQSATMNSIITMLAQCRNWISDTNAILDKTVVEVLSVADAAHALAQHELYQEAWAQNQSKLDKLQRRQQLLADSGNCIHTSVPKGGEELAEVLEASHSLESKLASRKAALTAELARQHSLDAQRLQWAKKAEDFVLWVEDIKEDLTMPIYIENGGEVDELIAALEVQVEGIRKSKTDDLQALVDLSQATMQDKVPNPYARFSIVDLEEKVKVVEQLIADRSAQLQAEKDLQASNQELRSNYLKAAEAYVEWQTDLTQRIEKSAKDATGTLQEQLEQVDKLCEDLQGGEPKKEAVLAANSALLENSVSAKSLAAVSTGDVETTFNLMRRMLSERRDLINEELIKENALAVSDEQLQELQELFKTFDKDGDEHLKSFEFKAVMQNMDIEVKEEDLQNMLKDYPDGIPMEPFVNYLSKLQKDTDTHEQLIESFQIVADNNAVLDEKMMARAMDAEDIAFLKEKTVGNDDDGAEFSFNYKLFAAQMYGIECADDEDVTEAIKKLEAEKKRKREEEKARIQAEEKARLEAEEKARLEAEEKARLEAEKIKAQKEEEERLRAEAEAKRAAAQAEAERAAAEAKAQAEAAAAAAAAEAERVRAEAEAEAARKEEAARKLAAEEAEEKARIEAALAAEAKAAEELAEKKKIGKKGVLTKLGGTKQGMFSRQNWKARFFIIGEEGVLRYYEDEASCNAGKDCKGEIVINEIKGLRSAANHKEKFNCIAFELPTRNESFWASADSAEERDAWVDLLKCYMSNDRPAAKSIGSLHRKSVSAATRPAIA